MVESGDLEAEFAGQGLYLSHVVGTIAMDIDPQVAIERRGQGVELQVTRGWRAVRIVLIVTPGASIGLGLVEDVAEIGHFALAAGRALALAAEIALGVFTTGHLEALRSAGEFHGSHIGGGNGVQGYRPSANLRRRSGQDLKRRHSALQRIDEAGVLGIDGVFDPGVGGDRTAHFGHIARLVVD